MASAEYLEHSGFLADVNNEREVKNGVYKERLVKGLVGRFVMYVFEDDTTVIPKESGWFAEVVNATSEEGRMVIPLRERRMYKEDWLGLRELDERGKLVFKTHPGDHMQLEEDVLKEAFEEYLGPLKEEKEEVLESEVVFDCLRYQPSRWSEIWEEIRAAWEHRGELLAFWRRRWNMEEYKQGL